MKTRKQLRAEAINAEERAVCHFRKLQAIEQILILASAEKTPAVYVVDKIKEAVGFSD